MRKQYNFRKVSLLISSLVILTVGILNILSKKYFYGVSMLLAFVIFSREVYRRYKYEDTK